MNKSQPSRADSLLTRSLLALALGALFAASWSRCEHIHRRRQHSRPKTLPEPLQTWEGEGGQHLAPASTKPSPK